MARNYHCFKWLVVFIFITCFATSAFATSIGTISGTVYESDGITPITGNTFNVSLYKKSLCDSSMTWVQAVTADSSYGTYTFTEVNPGSYYILAEPYSSGHIKEWWAVTVSQPDQSNAQPLQLNAGDTLTGINFQLDKGATLSGILYRSDGSTPVTGEYYAIAIYLGTSCSNNPFRTIMSNSYDGSFYFDKLPMGTYYINASPSYYYYFGNYYQYPGQWWTSSIGDYSCSNAQSITVAQEENITGKNFILNQSASISGTFYESDGTTPITGENLSVEILTGTPCSGYNYFTSIPINTTNGTYNFSDIPAGQYYLRTSNGNSNYVNGWWASSGTSVPCSSAEMVDVIQGQTYSGKNFELSQGAIISGAVYANDGIAPLITNGYVEIYSGYPCSPSYIKGVGVSTSDGTYSVGGLLPGSYYIRAYAYPNVPEWWNSSASNFDCSNAGSITITGQETLSNKNFQLDSGGTISGTLLGADGVTPVTCDFSYVEAFSGDPCGSYQFVSYVDVDSQTGSYYITGIPANTSVYLSAYSNYYHQQVWWASSGTSNLCSGAEYLTFINGTSMTDKNFQMGAGSSSISGTIYQSDGITPLTNANVSINVYSGTPCGSVQLVRSGNATSSGTYFLSGLPEGTYFLQANYYYDNYNNYTTEWWANPSSSVDCNDSQSITIGTGEQVTEKNFQLESSGSGSIAGILYQNDGVTPLSGFNVEIYVYSGTPCGTKQLVRHGHSDSSGNYLVTGLAAGTYFIQTSHSYYISEWWASSNSSASCELAQSITVERAQQVTGMNFQLEPYIAPPVTPPDDGGTTNPPVTPPDDGGTTNPPDNKPTDITDIKDVSDSINNVENTTDAANIINTLVDYIDFISNNMPTDTTPPPSDALVEAINTTTGNIGTLVEVSLNLFKEGKITLEQALKPVELLAGIINLGANAAKSGGAVSLDKVAGSIGFVEGVVTEAISQQATTEQMSNIAGNINNMLGNMPDIMNVVVITDDVVKIFEPIKGLTGAGITSSIAGNNDPSKTVDALGSIVVKGLEDASDAGVLLNTGRIINSAGEIVNYAVKVLQAATNQQTVVQNTLDQLQVEISEMFGQTASNIKDKPVTNSFAASSGGSFSLNDFSYVMDNAAGLTTSMIKAKSVLSSKLSGSMQSLSRETLKNILPAFVSGNKFAEIEQESDIQKLLNNYPQLLNEVIKIASVNLTSGMAITKDDISEIIQNNPSLTEAEKIRVINGLPELPAFDQGIIKSGNTILSLVDLLGKELPGTTVEVISSKGISLMVMLKNTSVGLQMPIYIQDARVVSSMIPSGLHILPEGIYILVRNGIAGIITPAPLDAVDTLLSADALLNIDALFGSAPKEISAVNVSNSGNLSLKFKDGSKFSGAFAYGTSKDGDGNFDAGTSSFELQTTDPASEAYSVLVTYNDGTTQTLSPSIAAVEQLVQVLDTLAAGSYTLDKSTGIFTVLGMRFKPSYLIEPITTSEQSWFKANKDSYGIAWETSDYNGDGAVDLKMWTADGKQVIYTVL